jgi:hypothetical protein
LAAALILNSGSLLAQDLIENSAKPADSHPGGILRVKEIFRIEDGADEFFFKIPNNLKIAPNGDIFVCDENQLLQFDEDGRFIRNLYRQGNGPGESAYLSNYILTEGNIIVHNMYPHKLLWFDYDGTAAKEFKIETAQSFWDFLAMYDSMYYFVMTTRLVFEKEAAPIRPDYCDIKQIEV